MATSPSFSPRRALGLGLPEEGRQSPFLPSGIPQIDARLGGLPRGRITEILGPASIGKSALLLETLGSAIRARGLAALVDLSGTIFPGAPWAERSLLVLRPRCAEDGLRAFDALLSSAAFDLLALECSGLAHPIPEALAVRAARLARETGSAVLACGTASLFGSSCALRLELSATGARTDAVTRARVTKSRQGALGEEIPLPSRCENQGSASASLKVA